MVILLLQYQSKREHLTIAEYITGILSGLYIADFGSGILHLIVDINSGHFDESYNLNEVFRQHHEYPSHILRTPFYESILSGMNIHPPLLCVITNMFNTTTKLKILTQLTTIYAVQLTTVIHRFTHYMNHATEEQRNSELGKLLYFLQQNHIIVSSQEHRVHHSSELHDINFCLINGWANPLLNQIVSNPCIHNRLFKKN
jgi:hypothetical protein